MMLKETRKMHGEFEFVIISMKFVLSPRHFVSFPANKIQNQLFYIFKFKCSNSKINMVYFFTL